MPKRKWPPRVGDRVIVPFGGYEAVGEVTRIEGWTNVYVTVEFKLDPDLEEPTMITYDLEDLKPAEAA